MAGGEGPPANIVHTRQVNAVLRLHLVVSNNIWTTHYHICEIFYTYVLEKTLGDPRRKPFGIVKKPFTVQ